MHLQHKSKWSRRQCVSVSVLQYVSVSMCQCVTVSVCHCVAVSLCAGSVFLWGKYRNIILATNRDGNQALCSFDIYVQCKFVELQLMRVVS